MDPEIIGDLLKRNVLVAAASDPHDIVAELTGIGPGHSKHPSSSPSGQAMSNVTATRSRPIRVALGDATKKGLIVRNVALLADPPTAKSARAPESETWTPEELSLFLVSTRDHRRGPLFHIAAFTGIRRGELCGL